jgi:peptide/nickel transport system permease protein
LGRVIGVRILFALLISILIAPIFAPYDPMATHPAEAFQAPSSEHLFGTDQFGRDVLSRWLHGGQTTVLLALVATASTTFVSLLWGYVLQDEKFWNKWILRIVIFTNNGLQSIPNLIITLAIITTFPNNTTAVIGALTASQIPHLNEKFRQILQRKQANTYVLSAKALGATKLQILIAHIAPNAREEIAANILILFQQMILAIAGLTFLGFGLTPGAPEWGAMLREGRESLRHTHWIATAPGLGITIVCAATLNYLRSLNKLTSR